MKAWNVSFACEQRERSLAAPNLAAESIVLSFSTEGGEKLREVPYANVPDLKAKVIQLLEQNDE